MNSRPENNAKELAHGASPEHLHHLPPLLELLLSQLQAAITDNNRTMGELMAAHAAIAAAAHPVMGHTHDDSRIKVRFDEEMSRMVIAFQGHDTLNQRIEHIIMALDAIHRLMNDSGRIDDQEAWAQLTQQISTSYTTAAERGIHTRMQTHASRGERACCDNSDSERGSIELF